MRGLFEFLFFLGIKKPQPFIPSEVNPNRVIIARVERRYIVAEKDYKT